MAVLLPPTPIGVPPGHSFWNDWYEKLRTIVNQGAISVTWSNINFTGSNITSIASRAHNNLQSMQGGGPGEYYHLTAAQYAALGGGGGVTSVGMSVPTGLTVAGSPITSSGTLAVTFTAGYSIPTTSSQTNWNTAFGWGNHASAGYLLPAAIGVTVQGYNANTVIDASYVHTDNNFTTALLTKLNGIATGATANSTDADLRDRSTHTGTQAQNTITNLVTDLAAKAPLNSPTFTGTVTLPAGQVVNGVTLTTAGGTTNFLRADGTYAAPPGGGGGLTAASAVMTATQASTSTTYGNVTELVLPLEANGVYLVNCFVTFQSAATTTGLGLGYTSPSGCRCMCEVVVPITSTAVASALRTFFPNAAVAANTGTVLGTGVTAINSNHTARISGIIRNGSTAGNFQVQFRSEVSGSAITLQIGSELSLVRVA